MSQFMDSEMEASSQTQSANSQPKTSSTLKLAVSRSPFTCKASDNASSVLRAGSGVDIKVRNKGPQFYEMKIQDFSHALEAVLPLDIEDSQDGTRAVCCHFPKMLDGEPSAFMDEEEVLYSVAMIRLHMKTIEQLLCFSRDHEASELRIYLDDRDAEVLQVYHHFLDSQEMDCFGSEDDMEIVVPVTSEMMEKWSDFMKKTTIKIGQQLWRCQRQSAIIRRYLKSNPFV